MARDLFPKVKAAREVLRERALEIVEAYLDLASKAKEKGNFEIAETVYWNLIEHMPAEDGERLIDSSAAKPKELPQGPIGPQIQIGIQLGPQSKPKLLEISNPIDIKPIEEE